MTGTRGKTRSEGKVEKKGKPQGFGVFLELPYRVPVLLAYLTIDHLCFSWDVSGQLEKIVSTLWTPGRDVLQNSHLFQSMRHLAAATPPGPPSTFTFQSQTIWNQPGSHYLVKLRCHISKWETITLDIRPGICFSSGWHSYSDHTVIMLLPNVQRCLLLLSWATDGDSRPGQEPLGSMKLNGGGGWFKAPLILGRKGESMNISNEAILEVII